MNRDLEGRGVGRREMDQVRLPPVWDRGYQSHLTGLLTLTREGLDHSRVLNIAIWQSSHAVSSVRESGMKASDRTGLE
jgi:hypothetical protein